MIISPHCNIRLEPFHVVFNVYDNSVEKRHTCCCCKTNSHYRSNMVPKRANIRLCLRNFICLFQTSHKTGAGLVIFMEGCGKDEVCLPSHGLLTCHYLWRPRELSTLQLKETDAVKHQIINLSSERLQHTCCKIDGNVFLICFGFFPFRCFLKL